MTQAMRLQPATGKSNPASRHRQPSGRAQQKLFNDRIRNCLHSSRHSSFGPG